MCTLTFEKSTNTFLQTFIFLFPGKSRRQQKNWTTKKKQNKEIMQDNSEDIDKNDYFLSVIKLIVTSKKIISSRINLTIDYKNVLIAMKCMFKVEK